MMSKDHDADQPFSNGRTRRPISQNVLAPSGERPPHNAPSERYPQLAVRYGVYTLVAQAIDVYGIFGPPTSPTETVTIVPPPMATITSGASLSVGQSITGTASDSGGLGVSAVILYYRNQQTGTVGTVATNCSSGCGTTNPIMWSYPSGSGTPFTPGTYLIVAQAIDNSNGFGPASGVQTITVE
jgi:hypothetical protein